MPDDVQAEGVEGEDQEQSPEFVPQSVDDGSQNNPKDASALDVDLELDEQKETELISYLEENLPNMKMTSNDEDRVKAYLAMYDLASTRRDFPYENAPSIPSSDAYDKLNEWLDKAEVAFLITNGTFTIDREEVSLEEQIVRRMEKTWHKKFFWGSGFANELRLILFEAGFLGGSILSVREEYDVEAVREKIVIKDVKDLAKYQSSITLADYNKAQESISNGKMFLADRDILKINGAGARIKRHNQTNFGFPQNEVDWRKWEIVYEREFYTKSTLRAMAEMGELDHDQVEAAIATNTEKLKAKQEAEKAGSELPSNVLPNNLDVSYSGNLNGIKEYGDSYEEEFCTYRVSLRYKVATDADPSGLLRSWIQAIYCPAGGNILNKTFCKDGFPYFLVQFRPVPHKAIGTGIAQARYPYNLFDSDMKSYFAATIEQEIGAPTLIKMNSNLWASAFRTYPGAVAYTENPDQDVKAFQMPEKSRLAVEGMKIALGSSPGANQGAGYNSGKREQLMQEQKNVTDQSRMHAIAVGLDAPMNRAWKVMCRVSRLNTDNQKWVNWVYKVPPNKTKLYMLEEEMDPDIVWTSVLSAIAMSPDALVARALQLKEIFHDNIPVSVNDPTLSIAWLEFISNYFPEMDDRNKQKLLPTPDTYAQYQQQLGQMGGQRQGAPATPQTAQSGTTPFHRPAGNGQKPQSQSQQPQGNGAFQPKSPLPAGPAGFGSAFNPRMPTP